MSQSLPNQVNDFNFISDCLEVKKLQMSQSLPNQVNDFNMFTVRPEKLRFLVAIPSKPGQRLQYITNIKEKRGLLSRNPFQTRSTTSMVGVL